MISLLAAYIHLSPTYHSMISNMTKEDILRQIRENHGLPLFCDDNVPKSQKGLVQYYQATNQEIMKYLLHQIVYLFGYGLILNAQNSDEAHQAINEYWPATISACANSTVAYEFMAEHDAHIVFFPFSSKDGISKHRTVFTIYENDAWVCKGIVQTIEDEYYIKRMIAK